MPTAFEKLEKILKLEQSQGFDDRAVIGGLSRFARIWQEEAHGATSERAQIAHINEIADLLAQYELMDRDRREKIVAELLTELDQPPKPSAPPRRPPPQKPTPPLTKPTVMAPVSVEPPSPSSAEQVDTGLDASVSTLPGISTVYTGRLKKLGVETVRDLLHHYPHRYQDYSTLKPINHLEYGEETTIIGTIWETQSRRTRGGSTIVSSIIADASGTIEAIWFNQPYLMKQLRAGRRIVLSGKIDEYLGRLTLQSPEWEPLEREQIHTGRLVPIYPLTQGITSRWMRRLMKRVVDHWAPRLQDYLPETVRERSELIDLKTAIQQIHFPDDQGKAELAHHRLAYDEFLFVQLRMLHRRRQWQSRQGIPISRHQALLEAFLNSLPYQLTEGQQRSLEEILQDLEKPRPMSRLLQGDVGSGKTVVAAAAILMAVVAGKQAALMVPTEILAEQHHQGIVELLAGAEDWGLDRPLSVILLTGSLGRVARRNAYTALASGEADVVIGTQALIQRHVTFKDLGLVIVDEQHRFGVIQRAALRQKGASPHVLVMSATPIPRSLALTVYGDLELSIIDELPSGRRPIQTRWLLPKERERAYAFVRSQVQKGRQAYILCPLVEESESVEARAAVEEYDRLQETVFPDLRLDLLHGRLKSKEKDSVMTRFRNAETDILVSTSVIEVGIDVPNATVILIEGADRFGLSQLHQFRGRVGRGTHQSYCLLLSDSASPDDPRTKATWERLKAIEGSQDGFVLAEKDLELRGPGDFLGVRQSGLPSLRLARLSSVKILEQARTDAQTIFREDPDLSKPEHRQLADEVARFWQGQGDLS
jgi:ATP-dependent DNA helicase RecG